MADKHAALLQHMAQNSKPVGVFAADTGRRIASPSGKMMDTVRPCSNLALRMRGICRGTLEDQEAEVDPEVLTAGGVVEMRRAHTSMGSRVLSPYSGRSRALLGPLVMPKPTSKSLEHWFAGMMQLYCGKITARRTSTGFLVKAAKVIPELSDAARRSLWQKEFLRQRTTLETAPALLSVVENSFGDSAIRRAASLIHAALVYHSTVQHGAELAVISGKRVETNVNSSFLFGHCRLCGDGEDSVAYFEGSTHVVVGYGTSYYSFDTVTEDGEVISSHEVAAKLQAIVDTETTRDKTLDCDYCFVESATLGRDLWFAHKKDMAATAKTNAKNVRHIESALFAVKIVDDPFEFGEHTLINGTACPLEKSFTMTVFGDGVTVVRSDALLVDCHTFTKAVAVIHDLASNDPFTPPEEKEPLTIPVYVRKQRGHTPAVKDKSRGEEGANEEEQTQPYTLYPPKRPGEPARLPMWMPLAFCEAAKDAVTSDKASRMLFTIEAPAADVSPSCEGVIHLALLLAAYNRMGTKSRLPVGHHFTFTSEREPQVFQTLTPEVVQCLVKIRQSSACGYTKSDIQGAVREALASLYHLGRPASQLNSSLFSDFSMLLRCGALSKDDIPRGALDTFLRPCDVAAIQLPAFEGSADVFSFCTPLHVNPSIPILCYCAKPKAVRPRASIGQAVSFDLCWVGVDLDRCLISDFYDAVTFLEGVLSHHIANVPSSRAATPKYLVPSSVVQSRPVSHMGFY